MENTTNLSIAHNQGVPLGQNYGCIYLNTNPADKEDEEQKAVTAQIQKCRDTIYLTDPAIDRETIKSAKGKRVNGTCEWIKDDPRYRQWLSPTQKSSSVWMCGRPGKGKTMVAMFLTEELQKVCEQQKQILVFSFCDHRDSNRLSTVALLRGVIWQILMARPELYIHVLHCAEDTKQARQSFASREALWMMFENILKNSKLGGMICLIDGLDECDSDSVRWLSQELGKTLPEVQAKLEKPVRLFITSQPEFTNFSKLAKINIDALKESVVDRNVKRYIANKTHELYEIVLGFTPLLRNAVEATLSHWSEGSFLWLGCVIAELERKSTCTEVFEALEEFPTELGSLYN